MIRHTRYPHRAEGGPVSAALSATDAPVLLNGMRVEFSERVALYPVDLEHVPSDDRPGPDGSGGR